MTAAMLRPGHAICATVLVLAVSGVAVAQTAGPPAQGEQHAAAPAKKSRKSVPKSAAAHPSPEVAERLIESANKALQAGKTETATQQLTRVIGTSGLGTPLMARALYLRGQAFRKQGKPAQAISDFTSAIWLKGGLNDAERADALQQRVAAYRDAGLSDPGLVDPKTAGAPAPKAVGGAPSAAPAPGPVLSAAPDATPAPQQESGLGGFLSSLFGGSSAQQPAAAPPPPPPVTAAVPQTGTAWSSHTAVVPAPTAKVAPPKGKRVASAPPADSPPPKVAAGGRLKIQVASVKTREEAEALAARIRREHAAALGTRQTEIDSANLGAFGTLFRVRIGTFAVAEETRALCQRLRSSGLDCMVVTR